MPGSTFATGSRARRLLAPEVIQTSAMDCGPAALKCLLQGFSIPVSYGRLREACQTDLDGTSIDVLESMANQLGLLAEQVMLPCEYLWLPQAQTLPAIVVVRCPDGFTHFVVVWRRLGSWLQVMDPATGRRWVHRSRFAQEVFQHRLPVDASDWAVWAASEENRAVLQGRLRALGANLDQARTLTRLDATDWYPLAALDAAARLVGRLVNSGALRSGRRSIQLFEALYTRALADAPGTCRVIPANCWSVMPHPDQAETLILQGAVLLRIIGRHLPKPPLTPGEEACAATPLSPEMAAALAEPPVRPLADLWRMLRADGLLTPLALTTVLALSVGGMMVEAILFRGFFDVARDLALADQRLLAMGALALFMVLLWALELPVVSETQRLGRHLDIRLRLALLRKLPRLGDRYLQSRPISDMADRGHSIHLLHGLPGLGVTLVSAFWDLLLTLIAIGYIAPHSLILASLLASCVVLIPLAAQPLVAERDLRMRSHAGALSGFYLDALLGITPVRTHAAERVVRREHEGLLTQWFLAGRRLVGATLTAEAIQSLICLALAGWIVLNHVERAGVSGDLLLLIYWVLKLPVVGEQLAHAALTYPGLRNTVLRLLEPLGAPEGLGSSPSSEAVSPMPKGHRTAGAAVQLRGVQVVAGGHVILEGLNLTIRPGEHLAIVGQSGAGKSTLLGLLLGWHRCAAGTLEVDGTPLGGQVLDELRRETAWVDPGIQLWNRPLLANLRYSCAVGPMAGLGEVLERANLTRVLASLPEGLQTLLGEGGARLSGGEGQRVRLGRALWQTGVRLALLDEPFRGLDRDQRSRLLGEARSCWAGATLLYVTHDLAETLAFDRVLVIEDGGLVEEGIPAELAADTESRYRTLLDAETALKDLWGKDTPWRRLRLDEGQLQETSAVGQNG